LHHPSSCVSPDARGCTLYLTQLGGFFLRKIFSRFFSRFSSRLFFKIFSQDSFQEFFFKKFLFSPRTRLPLLISALIRLYTVLNRLILIFSKKRSLSRDKATELSQVERTPTCIGADPGSWVTVNKKTKSSNYKNG
jgi:hypothetical protein